MKSSAYYPNPGTPKRIYSNNLLKEIHASVAPYKGGFVEWFIAEVDARWELMQDLEKMEKSILYWTGLYITRDPSMHIYYFKMILIEKIDSRKYMNQND